MKNFNFNFYGWMVLIGGISFYTGHLATFMMLYLILITLKGIHSTIIDFYEDWKSRN